MEIDLRGIIVPIVTPMNDDESINYEELKIQIDRMISNGISGIFFFGTNGEGYILSHEEKLKILRCGIRHIAGRVPVYAGTGCISTKETIQLSMEAADAGADVLSVITPFFALASQEELFEHYCKLASAVPEIPVVLYNIPARCGNSLAPDTVKRLAEIDNIRAIKDSSGNFLNILNYLKAVSFRQDFSVFSGNDQLILWTLLAGGSGAISGCANVYPRTVSQIYELFVSGNIEQAMEKQDSLSSFRDIFKYGNPNTIVKKAVNMLGFNVGNCRSPFNWIPDEGIHALENVLIANKQKGML